VSVFSRVIERVPSRVIELQPNVFADEWPDKPSEPIKAGLRLLSEGDIHTARAQAADRATQLHEDQGGRVEAYNDALMAWAVASSLCHPTDTRESFLESAFENVFLAFTSEGIRRIWEEIEVMHLLRSPLIDEIDATGLESLVADLQAGKLATLGAKEARVRRLLSFVLEELRA
jgi:hypothetical protein